MLVVKALCSAEIKARFRVLAAAEGLTESMLLRRMVATVVAQPGNAHLLSAGIRGGRGGQSGQIKLRLRPAEIRAVRALAEPEGYSAQAWIVRLLRYRLERAIPFAREELEVQRAAIRELSAVGRNLNTIAHRLLRSGQFEGGNLKLDALAKAVEQLRREMVATITRAAHRAHRSDG